ncbi:MAG: tail fiber domain-containing protein [Draconibacterium sp.]|nr:tail fiber domain-containing protein [Draconibacterium sp.]
MKKNLMYLVVCFVFISFSSYAQIKVNSSGRVGIGGLDPDATYNLKLSSAIFVSGGSYPDIIISSMPDGYGRAIYPSSNGQCKVGTSDKKFLSIHGLYIYQNGSLVSSDQRLKENFRTIEKPLEKLMQMNGLKYDFIEEKQDTLDSEKAKFAKLEKTGWVLLPRIWKIFPKQFL